MSLNRTLRELNAKLPEVTRLADDIWSLPSLTRAEAALIEARLQSAADELSRAMSDLRELVLGQSRQMPPDNPENFEGGAPVGAGLTRPPTPRGPGSERTFDEATAPVRNP